MKVICVRPGYREQDVWRGALGQSAALFAMSSQVDCIDAPDVMPAGSTVPYKEIQSWRPTYCFRPRMLQ